jgi:hypothetical protein
MSRLIKYLVLNFLLLPGSSFGFTLDGCRGMCKNEFSICTASIPSVPCNLESKDAICHAPEAKTAFKQCDISKEKCYESCSQHAFKYYSLGSGPIEKQDLEWVQPGVFTFSECTTFFGGDRAPTRYADEKYYDKRSCIKAYIEDDRCALIAQHIEKIGLSDQCITWLINEVSACRKFLKEASRECSKLAK